MHDCLNAWYLCSKNKKKVKVIYCRYFLHSIQLRLIKKNWIKKIYLIAHVYIRKNTSVTIYIVIYTRMLKRNAQLINILINLWCFDIFDLQLWTREKSFGLIHISSPRLILILVIWVVWTWTIARTRTMYRYRT